MKPIIIIKRIMFDGKEILFDLSRSFEDATKKYNEYIKKGHKVSAYELTGGGAIRLQF